MGCFITITHTKKVLSWALGNQKLKWGSGGVAIANIQGGGGVHLTVGWLHSSGRYCLFTPCSRYPSLRTADAWKRRPEMRLRFAGYRYPGDLLFEGERKTLWESTTITGCSTTYPTEVLFEMPHFGFRVASFLISGDGGLPFYFSLSKIIGLHSSRMVVRAKKRRAH